MTLRAARWLVSIFLSLMFFSPMAFSVTITLGTIEESPQKGLAEFRPLAQYLKKVIGLENHIQFEVVVHNNLREMKKSMATGVVDIYIDSPLSVESVCSGGVCDIALRRWKKGVEKYHSVIFSRKDSGITTEKDLVGKTLAFEEPFSTSSFLLPKSSLVVCCDISLMEKSGRSSGYIFSEDDENTMVWVVRRKVDAGAMSEKSFHKYAKKRVKDLQIIHRTISVPRHVLAMRSAMPTEYKNMIINVLTGMHNNDAGKMILKKFNKTAKFDRISDQEKIDITSISKYLSLNH